MTSAVCCPFCPSGPLKRLKIPSNKYPAFFEKWIRLRTRLRWTGRKQKYTEADVSAFFLVKKSFPSSPDSHPPYPKRDQISSLPTMSVMDLYP